MSQLAEEVATGWPSLVLDAAKVVLYVLKEKLTLVILLEVNLLVTIDGA